jgi:hypothetical protein
VEKAKFVPQLTVEKSQFDAQKLLAKLQISALISEDECSKKLYFAFFIKISGAL